MTGRPKTAAPKRGRGRPPTIKDTAKVKRLLSLLRLGMPRKDACSCAGTSYSWLKDAITRGRNGEKEYTELLSAVRKAESVVVRRLCRNLLANGDKGDTGAAIYMLKQLRPKHFNQAQVQRVELNAASGGTAGAMMLWAGGMPPAEVLAWAKRNVMMARNDQERANWERVVLSVEGTVEAPQLEAASEEPAP